MSSNTKLLLNSLRTLIETLSNSKESFIKNNQDVFYNITSIQAEFLKYYIKHKSPNSILEIGTSNGYSLAYMLNGVLLNTNPEFNYIVSVEIDTLKYKNAHSNLLEFINLGLVKLFNADIFNKLLLEKIKLLGPFEVIFVDCLQHRYLDLLSYITSNLLLSQRGVIILDNIFSHDIESKLSDEDLINLGLEKQLISIHDGFLILKLSKKIPQTHQC